MSESTNIELSKDGIKFPYRRYLSDSAAGFMLLLLVTLTNHNLLELVPSDDEVKVFIFLLLFLLATPLGLLINALGWALFEGVQKKVESGFLGDPWFPAFKREYKFEPTSSGENDWFQVVRGLETKLVSDDPALADRIDPLRGSAILFRSLSFLALMVSLLVAYDCVTVEYVQHSFYLFLSLFVCDGFLLISAAVSFYFHVQIVFLSENQPTKAEQLKELGQEFSTIAEEFQKAATAANDFAKAATAAAAKQ
jgi:hypothetical protein